MANQLFEDLRAAFATNPREWARTLGLEVKGAGSARVLNCVCPLCETGRQKSQVKARLGLFCDNGNALCKGCDFKSTDIVDTFRQLNNIEGEHAMTTAAQRLADLMKVPYEKFDPDKIKNWHSKLPSVMTQKVMESATIKLMDGEDFAPLRKWIRDEWSISVEEACSLGVGAWKNNGRLSLVYPCHDEKTGKLVTRYKVQTFEKINDGKELKKSPRRWSRGQGRCPDLWPRVKESDTYLIVEGESDAVVADALFGREVCVLALTKGKTARLQREHFPPEMKGKKVIICQDLDAFRGPRDKIEGGSHADREKVWAHTTKNLRAMALYFQERDCEVVLARIPLDPVVHPKGDLRDWVASGGRELGGLDLFTYDDVFKDYDKIVECESIDEVLEHSSGTRVSVVGKAITIAAESAAMTHRTRISCDMMQEGMEKLCERCYAPRLFGDKVIRWEEFEEEQTAAALSRDATAYIARNLLRKPYGCSSLKLETLGEAMQQGYIFELGQMEGVNEVGAKITVLSSDKPTAVGSIKVIGRVYVTGNSAVLRAESIEELDATNSWNPEDPLLHECLAKLPHGSNDLDRISEFAHELSLCIGDHMTRVYGQPHLQLGVALAMCSSLFFRRGESNTRTRGFMDVGIIGSTRSGKSQTLKGFITSERFGIMTHAGVKVSIAGLTISNHRGVMRPGTLPRFHGRAVVLDEFHTHIKRRKSRGFSENLLDAIQGARSDGMVNSNQMTGDFSLAAAVRLFLIANPPNNHGNPEAYGQHYCRHFKDLYDSEECLARMDYPLWVGRPESKNPAGVPNKYPRQMVEYIISRAWAQSEDDVILCEGVDDLARTIATEWGSFYDEKLPLYTGSEKDESLLRVAIAIANLTMSHPHDDYRKVEVRKVHVLWAKRWFEDRWQEVGYDTWSARLRGSRTLSRPAHATAALLAPQAMDAAGAAYILNELASPQSFLDARHIVPGNDWQERNMWLGNAIQNGVFRVYDGELSATDAGRRLISALVTMAEDDPELFERHRKNCIRFASGASEEFAESPPDLSDQDEWDLFRREHNL